MSFRARAVLNCTRIPRSEPSYIQSCVQVNVLHSWIGVPKTQFLKVAFYCTFLQVFYCRSWSWGKRSMSLHGIQEIRNLVNIFANNVFIASNYSRCVV